MTVVLSLVLGIAGFAAGLGLVAWACAGGPGHGGKRGPGVPGEPMALGGGPDEPCWTERIGGDGGRVHARSHCVDAVLMDLDARARRDDYPIPNASS